MAQPSSRQGLIDYGLRQLGAPVLEINIDDDQIDDLLDDAVQVFNERCFDGVEEMFLKHEFTQQEIDRGKIHPGSTGISTSSIVGTAGTSTNISGYGTTISQFTENSNFIQVPDSVIGIEKIFKFDTSSISGGMFSIKYQLFLNDLYYFNSVELLQYSMVKSYLEDIDFLLTPERQIRFNKKQKLTLAYKSKSDALTTILLLKSAFSIIDQIFQAEIKAAEERRRKTIAAVLGRFGPLLGCFRLGLVHADAGLLLAAAALGATIALAGVLSA